MSATAAKSPAAPGFKIPLDLIRSFQTDVRVLPQIAHNNGYITFDIDMLISVLRKSNVAEATKLASGLEALKAANGSLVIFESAPAER